MKCMDVCVPVLLALAGVLGIIVIRTLAFAPSALLQQPCRPSDVDYIHVRGTPLQRFQHALRIKTVSYGDLQQEYDELKRLIAFINKAFPLVHSSPLVEWELVSNYSLLYTVRGSRPELQPYLLTAHMDVVPASPTNWLHPPFDAVIDDDFIYARGTIDDKHSLMGILEALEFMLSKKIQPKRSFYIGFGHDEEIRGYYGARKISELLQSRGVKALFLLDEGMTVTDGLMPGAATPVAFIGTSEKGFVNVKLSVNVSGGHSSMPLPQSSIGILADAISRLERHPQPSQFGNGDEIATFEHSAHVLPFYTRMVMSNLWLFSPLVSSIMSKKPSTNALLRTTTAVTMFNAGVKDNVIASYAEALVNHRVHPAQTIQQVVDYDKYIIADPRVNVEVMQELAPSVSSPYSDDAFGYQTIKTSIRQVWSSLNVAVAPAIMLANTDTKWYSNVTTSIYRFSPAFMHPEDLARFHGENERISVANYEQVVNFYYHVMRNSDAETIPHPHAHTSEL